MSDQHEDLEEFPFFSDLLLLSSWWNRQRHV